MEEEVEVTLMAVDPPLRWPEPVLQRSAPRLSAISFDSHYGSTVAPVALRSTAEEKEVPGCLSAVPGSSGARLTSGSIRNSGCYYCFCFCLLLPVAVARWLAGGDSGGVEGVRGKWWRSVRACVGLVVL